MLSVQGSTRALARGQDIVDTKVTTHREHFLCSLCSFHGHAVENTFARQGSASAWSRPRWLVVNLSTNCAGWPASAAPPLTSGSNGFVVAAGPPCGTVRAVPCARPGGGRSLGSKPSSAGGGGAHIGEPRKFTTNCDGS